MILEILHYLTLPFLLQGAAISVGIAAVAMAGGLVMGLAIAVLRLSKRSPLRMAAGFYIWFVRGTPLLLQLVFLYDALPPVGIVLSPTWTAMIAFTINQAAYNAELIRGGIVSVSRNQSLAAESLGMGRLLTLRRILLPQAVKAALPSLANESISLLKMTSLATVVSVNELTQRSNQIVAQNFKFFTVFIATGLIYLMLTSAISLAQALLERRFNRTEPRLAVRDRGRPNWLIRLADFFGAGLQRRSAFGLAQPYAMVLPQPVFSVQPALSGPPELVKDQDFLVCSQVCKDYTGGRVLSDVDLRVRRGEIVALIGPSGSGKSTLLRLINHLECVTAGSITVGGQFVGYQHTRNGLKPVANVARARAAARISMVFQHFNLFEHLSALENVIEAPCRVHGASRPEATQRGVELLAQVGLSGYEHHRPCQLSGGQQQRVAIARALAIDPQLVLFDEPTSALDPELVAEVLNVIRGLSRRNITMIIVTHELKFALEIADRLVLMERGRVVESGATADIRQAPRTARLKAFLATSGVGVTSEVVSS